MPSPQPLDAVAANPDNSLRVSHRLLSNTCLALRHCGYDYLLTKPHAYGLYY